MTPKRTAIKQALTELLEGINPDNDDPATGVAYAVDLRGKVKRGRVRYGDETPRPFVSILEAPKNEQPNYTAQEKLEKLVPWALLIQVFQNEDPENEHETDAADLLVTMVEQRLSRISEVNSVTRKGMYPDDFRLGGLIAGIIFDWPIVQPPNPNVSETSFGYVPLIVQVASNPLNPYVE